MRLHFYHGYEPYPFHVISGGIGPIRITWTSWQWRFILRPWNFYDNAWVVQFGPVSIEYHGKHKEESTEGC